MPARQAYDDSAVYYDGWEWQRFWRASELPLVLEQVDRLGISGRVLDAGTGTGIYAHAVAQRGESAVGLDFSVGMLSNARARLGPAVPLVLGDLRDLPFQAAAFDAVIAARVLSHIHELPAALCQLRGVVRDGGWLVVTDVDAAHDYGFTRLPTASGKIPVETYPRTLDDFLAVSRTIAGLRPVFLHRWGARTARWVPLPGALRRLDRTGSRPVAYVAIFAVEGGA